MTALRRQWVKGFGHVDTTDIEADDGVDMVIAKLRELGFLKA